MYLLYHAYMYLEFLILACTIYILAPCGLKSQEDLAKIKRDLVTPLAGVWIEIPFATFNAKACNESLPLRECGLKLKQKGYKK